MNTRINSGLTGTLEALSEQFTQSCHIQTIDVVQDQFGQTGGQHNKFTDLDERHAHIRCARASVSPFRLGPGIAEVKMISMSVDITYYQVLLFGFYPEVTAAMRCLIDADVIRQSDGTFQLRMLEYPELHDILGVENDRLNTITRLKTQILKA